MPAQCVVTLGRLSPDELPDITQHNTMAVVGCKVFVFIADSCVELQDVYELYALRKIDIVTQQNTSKRQASVIYSMLAEAWRSIAFYYEMSLGYGDSATLALDNAIDAQLYYMSHVAATNAITSVVRAEIANLCNK